VGKDGEGEHLRVPEDVTVVARAGQSLGGNRPHLVACTGLQHVEYAEPDGLLDLRIAIDTDVRVVPELVQVLPLRLDQPVPPRVAGGREGGGDLVTQCGHRASAGPAV